MSKNDLNVQLMKKSAQSRVTKHRRHQRSYFLGTRIKRMPVARIIADLPPRKNK